MSQNVESLSPHLNHPSVKGTRPTRIGMIVPSSNTCLEPQTYRILGTREDVTVHSARISVTRIALDKQSDHQFDVGSMQSAAELLKTADVDVIAWNGTSGSWLGAAHDREITDCITDATGVPATTSTLAYLEIFNRFHISKIALLTPYTTDVNEQVAESYGHEGLEVVESRCLGLSDNESFANVRLQELLPKSRELLANTPDCLVYLCTNMYGAPLVEQLETEFDIPVLDSVAVTLWHALDLAGADALDTRWGRLLSN